MWNNERVGEKKSKYEMGEKYKREEKTEFIQSEWGKEQFRHKTTSERLKGYKQKKQFAFVQKFKFLCGL